MTSDKVDLSALRLSSEQKEGLPPGRTPWKILIPLLIIAAAAAVFFLKDSVTAPVRVETVPVLLVSPSQANTVLTASGYVVAQVKAAVASKGTGRLEKLYVEEGDRVRKGQILAQLEDSDMAALLEKAHADLGVAEADSADSRQTYDRQQTLYASGLTSTAELTSAKARHDRVIASIRSARAAIRSAEVALENTRIRAPFDGTVLTKNADVGEVVAPLAATANSRAAVVTMADMSSLQVEADVSESNITRVTIGQPCEITLDAYPDMRYPGYVYKIVPTADRAKATVLTKIAFTKRDERVLPEMSAKVLFLSADSPGPGSGAAPKLTVPTSALVRSDRGWLLFRVREGIAEQVEVRIGEQIGATTQILGGVSEGDMIVNRPGSGLESGTRVAVQ